MKSDLFGLSYSKSGLIKTTFFEYILQVQTCNFTACLTYTLQ